MILGFVLLALAGCPSAPESAADGDPILARVGPSVIRFHDLEAAARARGEPGLLPRSGAGWEDLRARLLKDRLVEEVLLLDGRERALTLAAGAVDAEVAASTTEVGDDARLATFVDERHGSREAWLISIERRLLIDAAETALRAELAEAVTIAPEQVASARERFAALLVVPARLRVRQMFFPDADSARGALLQLQQGADFADLVRSLTGEDGDSGLMSEDSVPPVVLEATAGVKAGAYTEVVPSPLGYHLYQVLERQPGGSLDDEAAQLRVEGRLRDEAVDSRLKAWIAARTDALGLFVDEDAVASVGCCRQGLPYVGPEKEPSP